MSSRPGRSQQIKHHYGKIYALTAALLLVVAVIVAITAMQLSGLTSRLPAKTTEKSETTAAPTETTPESSGIKTSEPPTEDKQQGVNYVECARSQVTAAGPLRIVDDKHPFDPANAKDLEIIKTSTPPEDGASPSVYTWYNALNSDALAAFQRIQKKMIDKFGNDATLFVNISYTSALSDKQENIELGLLGAKCSDKSCEDVSHSDHATGYALDIRYKDGYFLNDGVKREMTSYLQSICADYGFVQSWVQKGMLATGKTAWDTWHFRYVGLPHALYMSKNGLTLEEYLAALRSTNYNKRLSLEAEDGTNYELYFIKAKEETTRVPVPAGAEYKIEGNGDDGFVITLTTHTEVQPVETSTATAEETATPVGE